jgi:ribosomal protein S18 acetylase RimI-like enzyme
MIRQALPHDAPDIAKLILPAMGSLAAKFANTEDTVKQLQLFERFVGEEGNQYSYHNILVWEEDNTVCGMIIGYNGGRLDALRKPFLQYIQTQLGFTGTPEDETQTGEYYIDCLSVSPQHQGKGIAKKLISALFQHAAQLGYQKAGLLVSKGNDKARKLYTTLGFEIQGEKTLLGGLHYHLQYSLR